MGTVPPENKGAAELACMPAHIHVHLYRSWAYDDCVESNARGVAYWLCLTNNGNSRHSSGTNGQMACLLMSVALFMHSKHCIDTAAMDKLASDTMTNTSSLQSQNICLNSETSSLH